MGCYDVCLNAYLCYGGLLRGVWFCFVGCYGLLFCFLGWGELDVVVVDGFDLDLCLSLGLLVWFGCLLLVFALTVCLGLSGGWVLVVWCWRFVMLVGLGCWVGFGLDFVFYLRVVVLVVLCFVGWWFCRVGGFGVLFLFLCLMV